MTETAKKGESIKKGHPPLILAMLGLICAVGFACFLGLTAYQNDKAIRESIAAMHTGWDERIKSRSMVDQDKAEIDAQEDRLKLAKVTDEYRQLYQLVSVAAVGLAVFALLCFAAYHFGLVVPLRKLEESTRALVKNNLSGHIWGLDRNDSFGSLAHSICNIRSGVSRLADMVVETEDGGQHIRFEGRGAAVFNALVNDLQGVASALQQQGARLEALNADGANKILSLSEVSSHQAQSLEAAIDASRKQLAGIQDEWGERLSTLFHQNNQIQGQSKQLVDQFTRDMQTLNQVAAATGARVAQTLQTLALSERDIKKAAQQSLSASASFTAQASDLQEKMQAATGLLRASGKVMSETTETARTRLNEAINSVTGHDNALRAFLDDTSEKTNRITALLEDVAQSARHASGTVDAFDARMAQFEEKSDAAFARIEESSSVIGNVSNQMNDAHAMMHSSIESMGGHTEMLARILTAIRDEYARFSDEWKTTISETTPVFAQLKDSSTQLQTQLRDEWSQYAGQSRQLLVALEQDVRAMNTRTQMVTQDTEKLISHLSTQTQRVSDNANHFDLQVANLSQRLEGAAATVLHSNEQVVAMTSAQIQSVHASVQDMAQRLGILGQLTGTLGAVAGQLGQIVPTLGDATRMRAAPPPEPSTGLNPAMLARFEEISTSFNGTIGNIKEEFDGVRSQIARWVDMLTSGYKGLNDQITGLNSGIDGKLAAIKEQVEAAIATQLATQTTAPAINLGEQLVPAMRLIHEGLEKGYDMNTAVTNDLQTLRNDLQNMASEIHQTVGTLQTLGAAVEQGFTRIEQQADNAPEPVSVTVDATRVENAASALDSLLKVLKQHSNDVLGNLVTVTERLTDTSKKLQVAPTITGTAETIAPITTPAAPLSPQQANLDALQQQIEHIATMLDRFSAKGRSIINPDGQEEVISADKSKAFIETVMATIIRLHHIAESIEKVADTTPPDGNQGTGTA